MSTTTMIPWNDGNGNIVLVYDGTGNGTITVSSDSQNEERTERSQDITVKTLDSTKSSVVTVRQVAYAPNYILSDGKYYQLVDGKYFNVQE